MKGDGRGTQFEWLVAVVIASPLVPAIALDETGSPVAFTGRSLMVASGATRQIERNSVECFRYRLEAETVAGLNCDVGPSRPTRALWVCETPLETHVDKPDAAPHSPI